MVFVITVGGVAKLIKAGSFRLNEIANRRCTLEFQIDSLDRSYWAAEDAEVIATEDGNRIFGGLLDRPQGRGMGGPKFPGISNIITAVDFQVYAERRFVNLTLAAGTLKSQLTTLVNTYLDDYGVTLDAGQVNGPMMPAITYSYKRLDAVMNELMTLTASAGSQPFVWEIDYFKVLSAYQPSTELAPFDLVGNNLPEVIGDIEVEKSRSEQYANRIILIAAPQQQVEREETFVEGVDTYPYQPQWTVLRTYGYVTHAGIYETLRIPSDPDPASWTWDAGSNELTRDAGAPSGGQTTVFKFDGSYSPVFTAEDAAEIAARGVWERVITTDAVLDDTAGQALVDAELVKNLEPMHIVKYTTWEQGLAIGQQQEIDVSSRNVNGTGVITEIVSRDLVHRLERSVTVTIDDTQTNIGRSWQADYETWFGDKTGGSAIASAPTVGGGGGTTAAGPGGPDTSVQYNKAGVFGGDSDFTYDADTNSVVAGGGGSSITADSHESCFVFGYNCHIADP